MPSLRRLRDAEDGLTLIEVMVAALLAVLGVMAVVGTLESSRRMVSVAERQEAATHQAEQDLERIISKPYAQIALASKPAPHASPNHPSFHAKNTGTNGTYQYPGTPEEPFVLAAGALASSATWSDGQSRLSGEVWRYVTTYDDPDITAAGKRVTVAVTVNGSGGPKKPVFASSIVYDPKP